MGNQKQAGAVRYKLVKAKKHWVVMGAALVSGALLTTVPAYAAENDSSESSQAEPTSVPARQSTETSSATVTKGQPYSNPYATQTGLPAEKLVVTPDSKPAHKTTKKAVTRRPVTAKQAKTPLVKRAPLRNLVRTRDPQVTPVVNVPGYNEALRNYTAHRNSYEALRSQWEAGHSASSLKDVQAAYDLCVKDYQDVMRYYEDTLKTADVNRPRAKQLQADQTDQRQQAATRFKAAFTQETTSDAAIDQLLNYRYLKLITNNAATAKAGFDSRSVVPSENLVFDVAHHQLSEIMPSMQTYSQANLEQDVRTYWAGNGTVLAATTKPSDAQTNAYLTALQAQAPVLTVADLRSEILAQQHMATQVYDNITTDEVKARMTALYGVAGYEWLSNHVLSMVNALRDSSQSTDAMLQAYIDWLNTANGRMAALGNVSEDAFQLYYQADAAQIIETQVARDNIVKSVAHGLMSVANKPAAVDAVINDIATQVEAGNVELDVQAPIRATLQAHRQDLEARLAMLQTADEAGLTDGLNLFMQEITASSWTADTSVNTSLSLADMKAALGIVSPYQFTIWFANVAGSTPNEMVSDGASHSGLAADSRGTVVVQRQVANQFMQAFYQRALTDLGSRSDTNLMAMGRDSALSLGDQNIIKNSFRQVANNQLIHTMNQERVANNWAVPTPGTTDEQQRNAAILNDPAETAAAVGTVAVPLFQALTTVYSNARITDWRGDTSFTTFVRANPVSDVFDEVTRQSHDTVLNQRLVQLFGTPNRATVRDQTNPFKALIYQPILPAQPKAPNQPFDHSRWPGQTPAESGKNQQPTPVAGAESPRTIHEETPVSGPHSGLTKRVNSDNMDKRAPIVTPTKATLPQTSDETTSAKAMAVAGLAIGALTVLGAFALRRRFTKD